MALKSMRLPPEGTVLGGPVEAVRGPDFPPGLTLHLDDMTLKMLGIESLPAVGDSMMLEARVSVVSVSESQSAGQGKRGSVMLQITDMAVSGASQKSAAEVMFVEDF